MQLLDAAYAEDKTNLYNQCFCCLTPKEGGGRSNLYQKYSTNSEFCASSISGSKSISRAHSSTGACFGWKEAFILLAGNPHMFRKEEKKPPVNLRNCSLC